MKLKHVVSTLLLVCLVLSEIHASFMSGIGPYEIEVDRFDKCPEQGANAFKAWFQKYRLPGPNEYSHRGNVTFPFDAEQVKELYVHGEIWKWSTDWTLMTKYDGQFCDAMATAPETYAEVMAKLNLSSTCPPPKGCHSFEDLRASLNYPQVPVFPYGKYKGIAQYIYKKEVQGCTEIYVNIKQKFTFP